MTYNGPENGRYGDELLAPGMVAVVIKGSCSRLRQYAGRYFLPAADRMQHRIVIPQMVDLFYTVFKRKSRVSMG